MNKKNKICFLNSTSFWGGGEKLHLEYALALRKRGYPVSMVARKDAPFFKRCSEAHFETKAFTVNNLSFLNPFLFYSLVQYFKKAQIHTLFISASPDLKIAAPAARKAGVKNIVYLRGLASPIKNNIINKWLLTKGVTHIIANSEETKRKMTENFSSRALSNKIKVIYHGIDLALFDKNFVNQQSIYQKKNDEIVFGNAGRLTLQKGQHYLVEIAKILHDKGLNFKILIAGTGEDEEKLRKQIENYKLGNKVQLLGFVENMEGFMKSLDVFVLTSTWEGFGYVIAEAMAAYKPVVAFDITSNPELIKNEKTGYLIPFLDLEIFSKKLIQLSENKKLSNDLGVQGRKRVEEMFQLNIIINEIESYLCLA